MRLAGKSGICTLFFCATISVTALAQNNPVPFINQPLVPGATTPGGPGFTLSVNGTGFASGSSVDWNGAALITMFVNQSQLTATIPASDIATAATASVTVTNPGPGGGTSNVQFFSIVDPSSAVSLTESDLVSATINRVMTVGDFNGDGKLDVVQAVDPTKHGNQGTCLLAGNGDGTFGSPQCFGGSWSADGLVTGDFNGDGDLDVAGFSRTPLAIQVMLGGMERFVLLSKYQPQATMSRSGLY